MRNQVPIWRRLMLRPRFQKWNESGVATGKGTFLDGNKDNSSLQIGILRKEMTYYINHRNRNNLLGSQLEVKKATKVNPKESVQHSPELHHRARSVNATLLDLLYSLSYS